MGELFELFMVLSFGVSWPISIAKSLKTKSAKGKSPIFLAIIILGYAFGILSKIIGQNITYVFYFYILNFVMVSTDLVIYFINKKRDANLNVA